jgi:hypothetical protein
MSDARVAGVVCEGHTDFPILRAILERVWPEIDVRCLQPDLDEMERARQPGGWSQVRSWCQAHAGKLEEVFAPDIGDPIDLLVIAIDMDIAIVAGIADPPRRVGVYETKRLREVMKNWLTTEQVLKMPPALVLSTPVMAIEAWILAALFPRDKAPEAHVDPAGELLRRNKLRASPRDGKPWKELHLYRSFAPVVADRLTRVRSVCSEADRFLRDVELRRAAKR